MNWQGISGITGSVVCSRSPLPLFHTHHIAILHEYAVHMLVRYIHMPVFRWHSILYISGTVHSDDRAGINMGSCLYKKGPGIQFDGINRQG